MTSAFLLLLAICLTPTPALADVVIPVMFVTFPSMILALIPVIFIEAYIIKGGSIPFKPALKWTAVSNAYSTIVGIPLAWIALAASMYGLLEMFPSLERTLSSLSWHGSSFLKQFFSVTIMAPWFVASGDHPNWLIFTALLFSLIPCFWASYFIERFVLCYGLIDFSEKENIHKLCFKANITSYLFLLLLLVIISGISIFGWLFLVFSLLLLLALTLFMWRKVFSHDRS